MLTTEDLTPIFQTAAE